MQKHEPRIGLGRVDTVHHANVLVPKAFRTKYRIVKIPTKEELDREYAYVSNAWSDAAMMPGQMMTGDCGQMMMGMYQIMMYMHGCAWRCTK